MISDELLKELKIILKEDYKIQMSEKDLRLFAENIKGLFGKLIKLLPEELKKIEAIPPPKK